MNSLLASQRSGNVGVGGGDFAIKITAPEEIAGQMAKVRHYTQYCPLAAFTMVSFTCWPVVSQWIPSWALNATHKCWGTGNSPLRLNGLSHTGQSANRWALNHHHYTVTPPLSAVKPYAYVYNAYKQWRAYTHTHTRNTLKGYREQNPNWFSEVVQVSE